MLITLAALVPFSAMAATSPTVTSVAPNAGPTAGGTMVTITGTDFTGATAVIFGATAAISFTVNSATQITAQAPAGSGQVNIRVTTNGGTSATSAWSITGVPDRPRVDAFPGVETTVTLWHAAAQDVGSGDTVAVGS